jgi:hypothetical protein
MIQVGGALAMSEVGLVESAERALGDLYKDMPSLKRLLGNAALDLDQFEFVGDYRSALNGCLRTASGLEKLPDVIEAALRDYPGHQGLKGISDKFEWDRSTADNIAVLVKNLSGFRVLLRQSRHLTRDELNKFDAALQQIFDLTEFAESRGKGGDADSGQWDDLNHALETCLGQFQLYRDVLDASTRSPRRRVPGAPYARLPLAEVADDKMTLIDAKLGLFDAVNEVVRSCRGAD